MSSNSEIIPFSPEELNPPAEWKLLLTPDQIDAAISRLAAKIDAQFENDSREIVYHNSQTQSEQVNINPVSCSAKKLEGKIVILADELYDNGLTLSSVGSYFSKEYKIESSNLFSCVALRKSKPHNAYEPPTFCGIDGLPDLWYVGYGLDDCGSKRGWRGLWAIPKIPGVPPTSDDEIFSSDPSLAGLKLAEIKSKIQLILQ